MNKQKIYPFFAGVAIVLLTACSSPALSNTTSNTTSTTGASVSATLPRDIGVADASKQRDSGAYILDVRETYEWNEGHIPNATLIPLGTLSNKLASVPKDKPIVVVCRSGNRSQSGRDILLKAGFTNVTSMSGGMLAWEAAKLPVTK
jgi:rhodanese-related sulfurtransferase